MQQADHPDNTLLLKMATRATVMGELIELEYEPILAFYNVEEDSEEVQG